MFIRERYLANSSCLFYVLIQFVAYVLVITLFTCVCELDIRINAKLIESSGQILHSHAICTTQCIHRHNCYTDVQKVECLHQK